MFSSGRQYNWQTFAFPDYDGIVLGSGLLSDNPNLRYPNARIMALRGELTKNRLNIRGELPLGDPGLLVADLLPKEQVQNDMFWALFRTMRTETTSSFTLLPAAIEEVGVHQCSAFTNCGHPRY